MTFLHSAVLRRIRPAFVWLCALGLARGLCIAAEPVETYLQPLSNPVSRQLRFSLNIQNPTGRTLTDQVVWLYGPVKRTATQVLEKLEINAAHQILEDALGNQIIKLRFDQVAPYSTRLVNIKADLLVAATPSRSLLKRTDVFLSEERFIEKDDREIRRTAAAITMPQAADTVSAIYRWVKSNVIYAGFIADDLGAKYAISNRRGDCTEYAYLVVALARAAGISARGLGGYVMDRNGAPKAEEYHNWAEVHADGAWRLVDAQKENFQTNVEQYVAMRVISENIPNPMHGAHRFRIDGEVLVRMN